MGDEEEHADEEESSNRIFHTASPRRFLAQLFSRPDFSEPFKSSDAEAD
jgi:hypothetical protein